jgi:tRNA(Ile)-lysidine synthase
MFAVKAGYRNDSTNASSDYKRNRIRNEVFPIFETVNPAFVRTLNREMGYLAEAGEIVREWCRTAAPSVLRSEALPLRIGIDELMSVKYWKYLLYYMLEPFGFNSSTLSSIESLLVSSRTISGKRFDSQQYALFTDRDELVVLPKDQTVSVSGNTDIMPVRGAGVYHFNGRSFSVEILDRTPDLSLRQPEGVVMLDADKLRFPFVLRCWRDGDWLVPFGMKGKKKVSDLFTDLKYDFLQKGSAVMIVDTRTEGMAESQHLAAVAGVRIDDRYKVTDTTESVVMIKTI